MQKLYKLLKMLSTLLFISLASCATTVTVYDKLVCGDLDRFGAHCAHTLTNEQRDIPKAQWDKIRVGWLCTDSTGYNDTETAIDQLCAENPCDYETRQTIETVKENLRPLVERAQSAKKRKIMEEDLPEQE